MHICLPDTREVKPSHGSAYLLYNVHIDGLYHCSLRYKQLLHLHQTLSKKFTSPCHQLPTFPPKKLLPLSVAQVEERRMQLEKYLQNISQDKAICNSSIFNLFLLEAQRESTRIRENQVNLDIELVNGQKIRLQIVTHDSADSVLTAVCRALGLNDRYHAYFCLCLCGYDVVRDKLIIKRRLSFFESPYVTLQMAIQQQEQLQNVLSASYSNSNNNNNNNSISCRCQSCAIGQQQSVDDSATSIPSVGSSSDSYVNNNYQQNSNHYNQNNSNNFQQYHHHGNHQAQTSYSCSHHNHPQTNNGNRHISLNYNNQQTSFVTHRILLRKSYWDPLYDTYLLDDQQALNLLFIQTVYDIKHSLMFVSRETYHKLETLLASDSKMEYILLARTLKYYNYVHFEPCFSDYPKPRTKVMISIGSKELNMRVLKSPKSISSSLSPTSTDNTRVASTVNQAQQKQVAGSSLKTTPPSTPQSEQVLYCTSSLVPSGYHHMIRKDDLVEEEYNFKVPLIRCWRLTSLETLNSNSVGSPQTMSNAKQRKSLSLFNSVVGSNTNNNNVCRQNLNQHGDSNNQSTILRSGTGGVSLISAITGINGFNSSRRQSNYYCCNGEENMRCTSDNAQQQQQFSQYELSFEYLVSKDTLKWITISSDQAIFISISLQGVVDELVSKRDGNSLSLYKSGQNDLGNVSHSSSTNLSVRNNIILNSCQQQNNNQSNFTYMYRNGTQKLLNTSNQQLIDKFGTTLGYSPTNPYALALARQRQHVRASIPLTNNSRLSSTTNLLGETSSSGTQTAFEIPVSIH